MIVYARKNMCMKRDGGDWGIHVGDFDRGLKVLGVLSSVVRWNMS